MSPQTSWFHLLSRKKASSRRPSNKTFAPMLVINKRDELEEFFHKSGKPRSEWRVGTEYEKIGIERSTAKAIRYSGAPGVETILKALVDEYRWEPSEEEGHITAL